MDLLLFPMSAPLSSPRRWEKIRYHSEGDDHNTKEDEGGDVQGATLIWWNLDKFGNPDGLTLHTGCPILTGSKWILNKFIRRSRWPW